MSEVPADAYEAYAGVDRVDEARAVAGPEAPARDPVTTYRLHLDTFLSTPETTNSEVAEAWSTSGMTVSAVTEGQR